MNKFEKVLKETIEINRENCKSNDNWISNVNLITNDIDDAEVILKSVCKQYNVELIIVDLKNNEECKIPLVELFDKLNNSNAILYLKNYTNVEPKLRYRFSNIYKECCATNKYGVVERNDLKYLGSVLISEEQPKYRLDNSETSCFRLV